MKWRLTFGDPKAEHHSVLNSERVEVPAGEAGDGLMEIAIAVEMARKQHIVSHVGWTLLEAVLVPDTDQIIDWMVPYPIARLAFDPTQSREPLLRQVWANSMARTIWLAIKYRHLTDQNFPRECLAVARAIRRIKPTDVHQLMRVMTQSMPMNSQGITEPFWSQFLPYVLGQKQFGYEVVEEETEF